MENRLFQVDAFTNEPFKGNPAGVMLTDNAMTADLMQRIAMEMNLSETAFVFPEGDHYSIRFFTPATEVALCGHATLSTGHLLYSLGLKKPDESILFKSKAGDLIIQKEGKLIVMDFPAFENKPIEIRNDLSTYVGFEPIEMYSSNYNWIIAIAESEGQIAKASPPFEALTRAGLGHLMITSRSNREGIDFVHRCFAPALGINEDPVTGSAHCALTPLWTGKLGQRELHSYQLSARTGHLWSEYKDGRVLIKGEAVTMFEIKLGISL
ncbi:MAG TPA: PhzF family phenazine biosynthesis protein [Lentimicrobium sp.]|nr:PhzF family phenazine biosynthesis protein [Lentimicrobium sp.]